MSRNIVKTDKLVWEKGITTFGDILKQDNMRNYQIDIPESKTIFYENMFHNHIYYFENGKYQDLSIKETLDLLNRKVIDITYINNEKYDFQNNYIEQEFTKVFLDKGQIEINI